MASPRNRIRAVVHALRGVTARIRALAARPMSRTTLTARAYYALASEPFAREFRAVLSGQQAYRDETARGRQRYLLRRNIHMLEKGLCMQPRREVFATEYIEATTSCFAALACAADGDPSVDDELQWANDVLCAYFDAAGAHPAAVRARQQFDELPLGRHPRATSPGLSPYARDLTDAPPVAPDALLRLAQRRRSVRSFADRPVERGVLELATEIAGLSPSACNRQPFAFRVFDDPALTAQVAAIPMGTRGWVDGVPAFAVIVGDLSAFFSERDRHIIYTDGALAAMSFVLALETMGVASCCVNWPDIRHREAAMAAALRLEPYERPIMCIAIGYPKSTGLVPFSQKKATSELLRFNHE